MVKEIQVEELQEVLEKNPETVLVDCREPDEFDYCRIEGAQLIPLSEFQDKAVQELAGKSPIYIHCHHGGRSRRACEFLMQNGFSEVYNVAGGIDAWSLKIDPKTPRY